MTAIWNREMQNYFYTPVGYVFMGVFLTLSSVMFYMQILQQRSSDLLTFIGQMSYLWMLLSPVLTMRLLAEEKQKRTDQLLLTSPISLTRIVLGKYLAATAVLLIAIALTNVCVLVIAMYGTVYPGEWFVGYLGFTLQAMAFLALDMFVTGFTRNPVSAAIAAFAANFLFWMTDLLADKVGVPFVADTLRFVSLYDRYEPFIIGQLSFASLLYFVTFIALCLIATVRVMDARRFSQGGAA